MKSWEHAYHERFAEFPEADKSAFRAGYEAGQAERECASVGAAMIACERARQIDVEGFGARHDDDGYHANGELARAAACYAIPPGYSRDLDICGVPALWPKSWHPQSWKPELDDRVRELAKAGALIAAEIDRLMRAAARESKQ